MTSCRFASSVLASQGFILRTLASVSCSCRTRCITPLAGRSMTCFRDLLTEAERALTSLSNGLAPCLYPQRQAKVLQAYSEATRAATTALQRSEAQLSLCSAYLIFAQKDAGTLNRLKCVQQAFSHLTSAADHASTSAIESAYVACKSSARGVLSNPDLDLNDALSFWTRVVSSAAKQVALKCKLSTDQAEWILAYGQRCMAAGFDYKTGLKCGHEAAGPVEVAIQSAQRLKDFGLVQKAEKIKEAIYTFIRCTCDSAQVRTHSLACTCFLSAYLYCVDSHPNAAAIFCPLLCASTVTLHTSCSTLLCRDIQANIVGHACAG